MFEMLVKLVFWIIGKLSNIIIMPLISLLELSIPDLSTYILNIESYLDQYLWTTLAFTKRVLINFGVPQLIFTFLITWYTFKLTMSAGVRVYALASNLWTKFKP